MFLFMSQSLFSLCFSAKSIAFTALMFIVYRCGTYKARKKNGFILYMALSGFFLVGF